MSRPIYPFPVLSSETSDYKNKDAYEVQVQEDARRIQISHQLEDGSIVAKFMKEGRCRFSCLVSVPQKMYRKTHLCEGSELKEVQEIPSPLNDLTGEIFLRPSIVSLEDLEIEDFSGFNDFYAESDPVRIPKGGIVAFSQWVKILPGFAKLFKIISDPKLDEQPGVFSSSIATERGFQIVIRMGRELYRQVVNSQSPVREHVLCSALTATFAELKQEQMSKKENDEDGGLLSLAKGLKELLEKKTNQPGIPPLTWEDEDFNSAHAASLLKPALSDE